MGKLFFSLTFYSLLTTLSLNAYAAPPVSGQLLIVALGDSLTEGLGVAPTAAYPALLEAKLKSAGRKVKVVNAGISGSTSASGPSRMRFVLKSKPNWVILALGANDGLRGLKPEEMKKNLAASIAMAKGSGARVLLAGMRVPPNLGAPYSKAFEGAFTELAKDKSIVFLPFILDKVAGEAKLNQSDGLHPNEEGHKIMADLIFKALEKNL